METVRMRHCRKTLRVGIQVYVLCFKFISNVECIHLERGTENVTGAAYNQEFTDILPPIRIQYSTWSWYIFNSIRTNQLILCGTRGLVGIQVSL